MKEEGKEEEEKEEEVGEGDVYSCLLSLLRWLSTRTRPASSWLPSGRAHISALGT